MSDKMIFLKMKMPTIRKSDTHVPPSKEGFLKMRESSKKGDTPKKIFLNIDGHHLINVDDISYVGIEKVTTLGSREDIVETTDSNENIRVKTVYMVKIRSSFGYLLWSSDVGDKEEITHLYYRIQEILKNYGISINYVEFEPSEFRL